MIDIIKINQSIKSLGMEKVENKVVDDFDENYIEKNDFGEFEEENEENEENEEKSEENKIKNEKNEKNEPISESFSSIIKNVNLACLHQNIKSVDCGHICNDCGLQIGNLISEEQEWRYYGNSDNRHSSNPSRIGRKKTETKNIYKDLEKYKLSDQIKTESNNLFIKVVDSKEIIRGNPRLGLIFAIVYDVYKKIGMRKGISEINEIFKIDKTTINEGLKSLKLRLHNKKLTKSHNKSTKSNSNKLPLYINISVIMDKFNANDKHKNEVYKLYQQIHNKHTMLNSAKPNSIACSLCYYYCRKIDRNITSNEFSSIVGLSNSTILKISKIIAEILNTPDISL